MAERLEQEDAVRVGSLEQRVQLAARRRRGLLHNHVLACFEQFLGVREVQRVGRGDVDGGDGLVGRERLERCVDCGVCGEFGGEVPRCVFLARVHGAQLPFVGGVGRGDEGGCYPACADDGEV